MVKFYDGNALDTSTKDELSNALINKIVKQEIDSKVFEDIFAIFTRKQIDTGFQIEEVEVGNLTAEDFDPTGAGAFDKHDLSLKAIYHKINRNQQYVTTVSDKQIKKSMLSRENLADLANAIVSELYNSSSIDDYENMKTLLLDICAENKNMVICDLNDNGTKVDAVIKAIKTLATRMTRPSTLFNFSGFKKVFNSREDLVLIMDASLESIIDVDSLAGAFHMDKKSLVNNIIVLDEMPKIEYTTLTVDEVAKIDIGEAKPLLISKYNSGGSQKVTGKAKCILCNKKAIKRDKVERVVTEEYNAKGRFWNYYLTAEDVLSYSPLKNAIVLVD